MKTLHLPIITLSCFLCLCLLVLFTQFQTASALLCPPPPKTPMTCSPSDGSCFTPDMAISPITSNKCIGLFTKFTSSENSTAKDLYLRFFNADTNQTTNNVSFFINVTKQDKILGHDLFYAHSGIFTIKFQPSVQVGDWIVNGDKDPVLGGFTSSNNTVIIYSSTFTKGGLYHIHTEVLAIDLALVNQTNTPKFDSWWSVDDKGNISKYDNSTISFGSTTPSVKIKDESPLKQFKSGIAAKDVKCKEGLQFIMKNENGEPACVKPNTATRLLTRGWLTLEKFEIIHQNDSILLDKSQKTTTAYDNNTRYPTGSVPVHTSGSVGITNVRNLPPIPNCTYSNNFCSVPANSVTPLPPIRVTPTISSNSNITKIISIGMSPNPLKVGDIPQFTVTYQNISGKSIYGQQGCGSDLTYNISPDANVKKIQVFGRQCAIFEDVIQPNQIVTDGLDLSYNKIVQQGLLNVTLTLNLSDNGTNWSNSIDTIQFDVNATR